MTGDQRPTGPTTNLNQRLDVDLALQAAGLGVWAIDPLTNQVHWDARCQALVGLAPYNPTPTAFSEAIQYIHPHDLERVLSAIQLAMSSNSDNDFDQTYRTLGADGGKLRWVRFWGKSYFTPAGELELFNGVAQDVTEQVLTHQQIEQSQRELLDLFEEAPVGIATISADETLTFRHANAFYGKLVGRTPETIQDKPLLEALPELADQGFDTLLRQVIQTGEPFIASEVKVDLVRRETLETIYVDLVYQPRREADKRISGVLVVATDVTQQVLSRQKIEESENRLRSLIAAAPAGIGLFVGRDLVIEHPNQTFIDIVGKGPGVEGLPLREVMPELLAEGQPFLAILDEVFTTGVPFTSQASLVKIVQNGVLTDNYYNISYTPIRDAAGQTYAILDIAIDVTAQVQAQQALANSEAHLQLLRDAVPAMIFYLDAQQRYQSYNDTFSRWFGVDKTQVLGKTVREFVGEVAYQAVLPHLAVAYGGQVEQYELVSPSPSPLAELRWLSITYTPHVATTGEVIGLVVHAADITQLKEAERLAQERETALRYAIDLAELGSYQINLATSQLIKSARVAEWYGLDEVTDVDTSFSAIQESDQERVRQVMTDALQSDSAGTYQVEYTVRSARTGQQHVLRTNGQVKRNSAGQALFLTGTVLDITAQRALQSALEQQVIQRTEELTSSNDALAATNAELEESNSLLIRSNENLQTFAYIASHDLQEPLRKIQQFGDLLKTRFADSVGGEERVYIERMQLAARRMSTLIKDLLDFSRISTRRSVEQSVALTIIVNDVLDVLEVALVETGAQVRIDPLPTVLGDVGQLRQLFQNLLSNALKFSRSGITPQIRVSSQLVGADSLPASSKPNRRTDKYHLIEVADNGIGFDEKYLDRIFQVFQRLHRKNEFAGTGVGLAICEKVVTNHGGAITARSQPGQGATFCVYLPAW